MARISPARGRYSHEIRRRVCGTLPQALTARECQAHGKTPARTVRQGLPIKHGEPGSALNWSLRLPTVAVCALVPLAGVIQVLSA